MSLVFVVELMLAVILLQHVLGLLRCSSMSLNHKVSDSILCFVSRFDHGQDSWLLKLS